MLGLGLGLWQNVVSGGGGGAAWSPASPGVTLVAWYDPSDLTTLFKNTAGTVPVTADGDDVLCIKSKGGLSGTDLNTSANGAGFVPKYRTGSGKPYLEFDAATFRQIQTTGAIQAVNATDGTNSIAIGWVAANNTGTQDIVGFDGGSPGRQVGLYTNAGVPSTDAATSGGTYTDTNGSLTNGTSYSLISILNTSTVEIFVNNASNGSTAVSSALGTSARGYGLGDRPDQGANFATGKLYGAVIYSGALNSTDRAAAHAYLIAKMP